jgi:hypothetical protein
MLTSSEAAIAAVLSGVCGRVFAEPPIMAIEWYVRRGAEQSGPITQQEFEALQEHLRRTDLLRRSDWREWRPFEAAIAATGAAAVPVDTEVEDHVTPQALLKFLFERDLKRRGIAPQRRQQYQYARVVEELLQSVIDEICSHPHWQEALRVRYREIVSMVEAFIGACNVAFWQREGPDPRDRLTVLWRHRDLQRELDRADVRLYLDVEALSDIALDYLRRDARSREFERVLVDALAAAEIFRLADEIEDRALLVEPNSWSFVARMSSRRSRRRTLAKSKDLLARMIAAYATLPDGADLPPSCRKRFESAVDEGVGWDPLMLDILSLADNGR